MKCFTKRGKTVDAISHFLTCTSQSIGQRGRVTFPVFVLLFFFLLFFLISWPRKMGLIVNFVAFAVLLSFFFFFPPIFISVVIYSELSIPVFTKQAIANDLNLSEVFGILHYELLLLWQSTIR